jgi:hypothetical protein
MPNMLDGAAGSSHICTRSAALRPLARKRRMAREVPAGLMPEDRIDLPEAAEDNCCDDAPRVDRELVEGIRQSIEAGDYLTSEKIDVTVDCIYRELFGR